MINKEIIMFNFNIKENFINNGKENNNILILAESKI